MNLKKIISQSHIRNVLNDAKKEVWSGRGSYRNFQETHLKTLDPPPRKQRSGANPILPKGFSEWNPEIKTEYLRKHLGDNIQDYIEDRLEKFGIKKPEDINPKNKNKDRDKDRDKDKKATKKKKKKKTTKDNKSKTRPIVSPIIGKPIDEVPPIETPIPRGKDSIRPPTIDDTKKSFDSRIGYFVTLSDIKVHTDEIKVYASSEVDFDFRTQPDQFLKLEKGQSWQSEWIDSGVIRGLDVGISGKHTLNYIKNSDFEI